MADISNAIAQRAPSLSEQIEDLSKREANIKEQKRALLMQKGWDCFRATTDFKEALAGLSVASSGSQAQLEHLSEILSWLAQEFNIEAPTEYVEGVLRDGV